MIRRWGVVWVLLAVAGAAWGDASSRLRRETGREHRRRRRRMTVEENWAERTMREIEAERRRMIRREAEIAPDYRTEASLIYLDRERAAGRDPFKLRRERERRLADARFELDGIRYYSASDYRMGSETRIMAARRGYGAHGGPYEQALQRAEKWAMDGAADMLWGEQKRTQAIIRRVLQLAEQMEQEAQAREREAETRK